MNTINVNGREIDVAQYKNDWALALMSKGVIVKLSISWWRAKSSISAEELGLRFKDNEVISFMKKYVNLGSENLLPPEVISEIQYIDQKARENLKNHSFDTIWGKFVPYTAFIQWQDNDKLIQEDFYKAAKNLCDSYDSILDIVRQEYRKMAGDVWARLYPNDPHGVTSSFVEEFVSKVISKIPSRNNIFKSFNYDSTFFTIPLPSLIEENISQADKIKSDREMDKFDNELEKETKKRIANEYMKRKQEYIDGFLEATVTSMRSYVADLCDGVLQSMTKPDSKNDVTKIQREKIKNIIKKVKLLNFHDDTVIDQTLKDLETEVDKFKGDRNKTIVVEKLQNIVDLSDQEFTPSNFNPIISNLEV